MQLPPTYRADLLIAAPKVFQAVVAALGDYYTWKLGERVYGAWSNEAWAAVGIFLWPCCFNGLLLIWFTLSACSNGLQSMAVVLLYPRTVELPRDDRYNGCA